MKLRQLSLVAAGAIVAACGGGSNDAPGAANAAPTIGAIADQSIVANQASPAISFSVSDERPDSLAISAISDNPDVVAEGGLTLSGSDTSRSLVITPNVDTTGDAFISIIATDRDGLAASVSFLAVVDAEQQSVQQFVRTEYAASDDEEPALINAVEFNQDADDDDFADLLAQ